MASESASKPTGSGKSTSDSTASVLGEIKYYLDLQKEVKRVSSEVLDVQRDVRKEQTAYEIEVAKVDKIRIDSIEQLDRVTTILKRRDEEKAFRLRNRLGIAGMSLGELIEQEIAFVWGGTLLLGKNEEELEKKAKDSGFKYVVLE